MLHKGTYSDEEIRQLISLLHEHVNHWSSDGTASVVEVYIRPRMRRTRRSLLQVISKLLKIYRSLKTGKDKQAWQYYDSFHMLMNCFHANESSDTDATQTAECRQNIASNPTIITDDKEFSRLEIDRVLQFLNEDRLSDTLAFPTYTQRGVIYSIMARYEREEQLKEQGHPISWKWYGTIETYLKQRQNRSRSSPQTSFSTTSPQSSTTRLLDEEVSCESNPRKNTTNYHLLRHNSKIMKKQMTKHSRKSFKKAYNDKERERLDHVMRLSKVDSLLETLDTIRQDLLAEQQKLMNEHQQELEYFNAEAARFQHWVREQNE